MKSANSRIALVVAVLASLMSMTANAVMAQEQTAGKSASKQEMKQLNKEANKLAKKSEEAAEGIGRNKVFCILAAHTTDVGTGPELKAKFDALTDFPFGQFVAAVLLADRIDEPLDGIIAKLVEGMSIGQITKEADVNMGEVRSGFGQFRSELARSMTNPPTTDCFTTTQ
jgi:hypothetical protein